ncbi:MAG: hypothetical protein R3C49_06100 [Planctomycetaceae bacterium]
MKPRYYPHITALGAVLATAAPLCIVLTLPYFRSLGDPEIVTSDAREWHSNNSHPAHSVHDEVRLAQASVKPADEEIPRVAMRPQHSVSDIPKPVAPKGNTKSSPVPVYTQLPPAEFAVSAVLPESPVPVPSSPDSGKSDVAIASGPPVMTDREGFAEQTPIAAVPKRDPVDTQMAAVDNEMNQALIARPETSSTTYFDATGHLAMLSPGTKPEDNSASAAVAPRRRSGTSRRPASESTADSKSSENSADRIDGGLGMGSRGSLPGMSAGDDDLFGTQPTAVIEDVILQQPLENRRVSKVENVMAVTRAKGWPIALVKSDLPDDHWWVQQMVGISGNAFAARVNFGNDDSIPGSVYHLVIVFLDSADEVRRFRIAKQFRELPEGTRQSRVFTFVRQ